MVFIESVICFCRVSNDYKRCFGYYNRWEVVDIMNY